MAQLDTSFYSTARPKSVAEYDAIADQAEARKLAGESNRLQLLLQQRQVRDAQRAEADQNRLRTLLQAAPASATDEDRVKLLRGSGFHTQADALEKDALDKRKTRSGIAETDAKAKGLALEQSIKAHEFHVQKLGTVATPQEALAWAQEAKNAGIFNEEQYARGVQALQQASQSPQAFAQWKALALKGGVSATEQVKAAFEAEKQAESVRQFGVTSTETARAHRASEGLTARGQNLTDTRAREANEAGKIPAGYRRKGDGSLEPIPGGPAAQETRDLQMGRDNAAAATDRTIGTIDRLLESPGRKDATGTYNLGRFIPGTAAADFAAELETLKAQTFLPMIAQMKGMGALSNAEGEKLNAAVGALNPNMSEKAFADSLKRIKSDLQAGRKRMTAAGAPPQPPGGAVGEWGPPGAEGRPPLGSFGSN
jgi:hypothetical protein